MEGLGTQMCYKRVKAQFEIEEETVAEPEQAVA
jgi:hypothetical protein